jgi:hypothetical protein
MCFYLKGRGPFISNVVQKINYINNLNLEGVRCKWIFVIFHEKRLASCMHAYILKNTRKVLTVDNEHQICFCNHACSCVQVAV